MVLNIILITNADAPFYASTASMNYQVVSFLISLVTVAIMLPGTFLLNARVIEDEMDIIWYLVIYLIVTVLCFAISLLHRIPVIWSMCLREIGLIGILCTLFLFACFCYSEGEYICYSEGEYILNVDGFWEGVGLWFVSVIILSACSAIISGAFRSLFSSKAWAWPAYIINILAYAVGAFFIGGLIFSFVLNICPAAAICSLIGLTGGKEGKNVAKRSDTEIFTDEYGREVRGHRYGSRFIEEGSGNVYRQRPDDGKWECM